MLAAVAVARLGVGQDARLDLQAERQTVRGNGINFEGYHRTGGEVVLEPKFTEMLENLADDLVRVGMPIREWEPENDDASSDHINWDGFVAEDGVMRSFERLQTLHQRGSKIWLAVWDVADWLVENPEASAQRRIREIDEFAEAIVAYLLYAREHFGAEPEYVSINEPSIASENGWGGYQLALTADEQAELIRVAGNRLVGHGLSTKWLIAVHKVYPSERAYAQAVLAGEGVRQHVRGFDFHGYWFHEEHDDVLADWGEWVATTRLPAFCGECDYDNQFWTRNDREAWSHAIASGKLFHKAYALARASGAQVWYDDAPGGRYPYRIAARHFLDVLTPGTIVVEAESDSPELLVLAGKGPEKDRFVSVVQNTSASTRTLRITGVPDAELLWIQSDSAQLYHQKRTLMPSRGELSITLPPRSIHSLLSP